MHNGERTAINYKFILLMRHILHSTLLKVRGLSGNVKRLSVKEQLAVNEIIIYVGLLTLKKV